MEKKVRVRFAPSPTGALHVGGVRTALYNYLFAKKHNGDFLLRIEDTDQERFVPGAEAYILEALAWCGITPDFGPHVGGPDAPYRQSERKPIYRQFAEDLIAKGKAYYAFDTPDEIEAMRKRLEAAGNKSPQYNAITRQYMKNSTVLPAEEVQRRLEAGEPYVIRLLVPRNEEVRFHDEIRGWVTVHTSAIDDKVLLKSDGMPTYHLANVVDDHLMKITHVIRGEEWLPSAPLHVLLYRAFGWEHPTFAHLPLLLSPDGNGKLSKRDGDKYGFPIFPLEWTDPKDQKKSSGYREEGYLPEAFVNFLALLGWNPGTDEEIFDLKTLVERFSLERVGKSGVKFDKQKSIWFNQVYIKKASETVLIAAANKAFASSGLTIDDPQKLSLVVNLLKDRVEYLSDFAKFGQYFFVPPTSFDPTLKAKCWNQTSIAFLKGLHQAWKNLPEWTHQSLETAAQAVAASLSIGIGKVMPAIRYALTGMSFGPGIYDIALVIGQPDTTNRIATALLQE